MDHQDFYLYTEHGAPVAKLDHQTPSFDIFRKWDNVIFGTSTTPIFFFFILVVFNESVSLVSDSVTDTKL